MKYYLDTSAIYHINKIPERILRESFYSSFALIELVSGITPELFSKRKVLLQSVINSVAMRINTFSEQIIFEAFDSFIEYEYVEKRLVDLYGVIDDVLMSPSFKEFDATQSGRKRQFDFPYFVWLDGFLTDSFYQASVKGNAEIRTALKESQGQAYITFGDRKFDLGTREAIGKFLNEPLINDSFTILALANAAINIFAKDFGKLDEEKVYNSYNGQLSVFIMGMSANSIEQIIKDKSPRKNDFQDLLHMLYLRRGDGLKIITGDSIFLKCIPTHTVSIKSLLG